MSEYYWAKANRLPVTVGCCRTSGCCLACWTSSLATESKINTCTFGYITQMKTTKFYVVYVQYVRTGMYIQDIAMLFKCSKWHI